ncbi:MAG: hypothetical protein AVDCRST_MAG18-1058, partial [uncultured Thermomicrobiales bacterium]
WWGRGNASGRAARISISRSPAARSTKAWGNVVSKIAG